MAEHSELVAEIQTVEKMTTAERLKHAKKRRNIQLKKFAQYEKQYEKENNKRKKTQGTKAKVAKRPRTSRVKFVSNIMLLEAATRNDVKEVDYLLANGVSSDVTNEDGLTALHQCCIDDLEELLRLLIKHGANVNAKDSELWTPLHAAATCGHVHLCRILVENGAELLAVNADGNMPYDICEDEVTLDYIESEMAKRGVTQDLIDETRLSTEHKMLNDMKQLADDEQDLEFKGRSGETPLHIAAANGYIQVAEFLLDHHVQVDVTDDDTWQPIHAAACWGHLALLELLVQHGADLEAKTKNGETPLDICEDPEVRQRITELRDEIKSHRASRSHDLRRRRSQNSRSGQAHYSSNSSLADKVSASIRRTSMREKTPIALKEAREEAQRLRESTGSADEEFEEEDQNTTQNKQTANSMSMNIFMPVEEDSPDKDINNIQLHLTDNNSNKTQTSRDSSPEREEVPSIPSHHAVIKTDAKQAEPVPPPSATVLSNDRGVASAAAAAPVKDAGDVTGTNNAAVVTSATSNQSTASSTAVTSEAESSSTNQKSEPASTGDKKGPQATLSHAHSEESLSTPPSGTLADLKKYRAQRLQENIRNKDNVSIHSFADEHTSQNHSDTENSLLTAPSNGQSKTTHNGIQYKNTYYIAEERPKHKFTASNTEIIGDDNKTGCCVIL